MKKIGKYMTNSSDLQTVFSELDILRSTERTINFAAQEYEKRGRKENYVLSLLPRLLYYNSYAA